MGFLPSPQRNQTVDRSHPLLRDDRPAFTCRGRAGRIGGFGAVGLDGAVVAWGAAGHLQWDFQKRAVGPVHKQVGSDVETVTAEKYADAQMAGSADRPRARGRCREDGEVVPGEAGRLPARRAGTVWKRLAGRAPLPVAGTG